MDHEVHVGWDSIGIFFVAAEYAVRQLRQVEFGDHRGEQDLIGCAKRREKELVSLVDVIWLRRTIARLRGVPAVW